MAGIREEFWVSTMTGEQEDKSASAMSSRTWDSINRGEVGGEKAFATGSLQHVQYIFMCI